MTVRDVLHYPFILPPRGSVTRDMLENVFLEIDGRPPQGSVETSSYSVIRYLLLNSNLICFRSRIEFASEMPLGRIVRLDLDFTLPARNICLLQRQGVRRTAAVDDFLEIVRRVAVEQPVRP